MKKLIAAAVILIAILAGIAVLRGPLNGDKKDYHKMVELGLVCQDKGEKSAALKFYKNAIKLDPERPQAHFLLGRLYFMMQKGDEAVGEFNIFMEKMNGLRQPKDMDNETYIKCLHNISDICNDLKKYDEMRSAINNIIALDPKDQSAYYNLGVYYYNGEHNRPKAYQNFKKAADLGPGTSTGKSAKYAIEFMRNNPDSRVAPDLSFIDQEYK